MDEHLYWVAMATQTAVGGATLRRLLRHFASLEAVFTAEEGELLRIRGVGPATAADILSVDFARVEEEIAAFEAEGVRFIPLHDLQRYPTNLLHIADCPTGLFVRGNLLPDDADAVSIVGTRQPNPARSRLAFQLAHDLAKQGLVVVSGLAFGIDAAAHQGALEAGGRTLAALGCGVLNIYPGRHASLAARIAEQGAVLCEVAPTQQVSPRRLIARNRITSGLARAVIVVEAAEDSGSISTARRAFRQGRTVYAVAGDGGGCDYLIGEGAHPLYAGQIHISQLAEAIKALPIVAEPHDEPPEQLSLL
jgi:DNA processing protein